MRYNIAVIPGDGTGPEVVGEGLKVLKAAAAYAGFDYGLTSYDFGGERYLRTGETLPDSAIEELRSHSAIFLGAIGHPDVPPGVLEQGVLLKARFALDQYINLRPVRLYPGVETPIKNKGPKRDRLRLHPRKQRRHVHGHGWQFPSRHQGGSGHPGDGLYI